MTRISVIVPCYNAQDFLDATIASVVAQDCADWELILVDDGSSDATPAIIARWAAADARIRGIRQPNAGTTRARNAGYGHSDAQAPYLWFLDHDDQLRPDALRAMAAYLDAHPEVGLVACQYEDVAADGRRLGTGHRSRWVPGWFWPRPLRDGEVETPFVSFFCATGQGPFALYRRSIYRQTEGWTTEFWPHEDTDMFCQMALLAPVHMLAERYYLKRIHPEQGMNDHARVQQAYARFRRRWDHRVPRNAAEAAVLDRARRHYYTRHQPFRGLKVAALALNEWRRAPQWSRWRWAMSCLRHALHDLFLWRGLPTR